MSQTNLRHCTACNKLEPFDGHWRALLIMRDGNLMVTTPLGDTFGWTDETVFACGQGSALVLVERYLHSGSFEAVLEHAATT